METHTGRSEYEGQGPDSELQARYASLVEDYNALVKMIEEKADEREALAAWGDPGWTLKNVFVGYEEQIERLQKDCNGEEVDEDLIVVSSLGLAERLLELHQKADELRSEVGGLRDDFLAGAL